MNNLKKYLEYSLGECLSADAADDHGLCASRVLGSGVLRSGLAASFLFGAKTVSLTIRPAFAWSFVHVEEVLRLDGVNFVVRNL